MGFYLHHLHLWMNYWCYWHNLHFYHTLICSGKTTAALMIAFHLSNKQKKLITQSLTVIMILIYHFYSCANRPMIFFLFLMSSWFALSSQITIRNTNGEMLSPLLTSSNWKRRCSTNNSTSIQRIHQLYIIKSIWAENNFIILLIVAFHLIILKPQCWWARLGMQCTGWFLTADITSVINKSTF